MPTDRPETLWFMNSHVTVHQSGAAHPDGLSMMEMRVPFGDAPPRHVHHDEDEVFMLMEGEIRFQLGGQERLVRAGDTLLAPKGVPHAFRVVSPEGARAFVVCRGGFERMVRQVSRPALADAPPRPAEPTPADIAALAAACTRQNIEILGPPLAA